MQAVADAYNENRAERNISRRLMWLVCAAATIATLVALFSRSYWFAELFSHFRLYYLLAQGVLLLVFLNTRRYLWLFVTLLLAVPNAWYVGPYLLPVFRHAVAGAAAPERVQLLATNLSYRNQQYATFIEYVREARPEVLVLSEYTSAWDAALQSALADYPHRVVRPRETPFGQAVYSQRPLRNPIWLNLGVPGNDSLRVGIELGGRQLELFAVHLYPPTSPERATWRRTQLDRLATRLRSTRNPRILVGDLNLTPFSPLFADFVRDTGLLDARRRQGLHITWPSSPLPLWIPIDHCLADVSAGVTSVRTGRNIGSDHYPLEISIADVG